MSNSLVRVVQWKRGDLVPCDVQPGVLRVFEVPQNACKLTFRRQVPSPFLFVPLKFRESRKCVFVPIRNHENVGLENCVATVLLLHQKFQRFCARRLFCVQTCSASEASRSSSKYVRSIVVLAHDGNWLEQFTGCYKTQIELSHFAFWGLVHGSGFRFAEWYRPPHTGLKGLGGVFEHWRKLYINHAFLRSCLVIKLIMQECRKAIIFLSVGNHLSVPCISTVRNETIVWSSARSHLILPFCFPMHCRFYVLSTWVLHWFVFVTWFRFTFDFVLMLQCWHGYCQPWDIVAWDLC